MLLSLQFSTFNLDRLFIFYHSLDISTELHSVVNEVGLVGPPVPPQFDTNTSGEGGVSHEVKTIGLSSDSESDSEEDMDDVRTYVNRVE